MKPTLYRTWFTHWIMLKLGKKEDILLYSVWLTGETWCHREAQRLMRQYLVLHVESCVETVERATLHDSNTKWVFTLTIKFDGLHHHVLAISHLFLCTCCLLSCIKLWAPGMDDNKGLRVGTLTDYIGLMSVKEIRQFCLKAYPYSDMTLR